jgi:diguanylate cyclase (GGDEF)-like protein
LIGQRRKIPAVVWLDALQGLIGIYLVHLQVFSSTTGARLSPAISEMRLSYAYNAGTFTLALGATLRVMAKPRGEEARLYRVLCIFMWVYALLSAGLNHLSFASHVRLSPRWDLLWAFPFVLLTILVARLPQSRPGPEKEPEQTWAGLIVTNASPVFFTMGLLIAGVYVGREHFRAGTAAIAFALILYALRSSILQTESMRMERKLMESEAALVSANSKLRELSFVDPLTGLANRRRFEVVLTDEWNRCRRLHLPLSLLVIDIDHFKRLNDRYGHLRGDRCLSETAHALSSCLSRSGEMVARYGGEEFVVLLPGLDLDRSCLRAEQMRQTIEGLSLPNEDAPSMRMTVSIGAASTESAGVLEESDLFAMADRALYQAKLRGRNRVEGCGLELQKV